MYTANGMLSGNFSDKEKTSVCNDRVENIKINRINRKLKLNLIEKPPFVYGYNNRYVVRVKQIVNRGSRGKLLFLYYKFFTPIKSFF